MKVRLRKRITPILVVLGWATSSAAFTLQAIFQGQLLPRNINGGGLYSNVLAGNTPVLVLFYAGNFAVAVIAAMAIGEIGRTILSFFSAYAGCAVITFLVLSLPDFAGVYDPIGAIENTAAIFTFVAVFPGLLLTSLAGTVIGMALGGLLL